MSSFLEEHSSRQLFRTVSQKLSNDNDQPLRMFVTGGAGTGKTFTLQLIVEEIRMLRSNRMHEKAIIVTAPTGVAVRLLGGSTLHSTVALPIEKGRPERCDI